MALILTDHMLSLRKHGPVRAIPATALIDPGNIILLHDGLLDRIKTVLALPILLDGLKGKSRRATNVGDLLKKVDPKKTLEKTNVKYCTSRRI
jgi:peptidoglycan/xylan/chitin deacetylase (PgdA/CDA1 family)